MTFRLSGESEVHRPPSHVLTLSSSPILRDAIIDNADSRLLDLSEPSNIVELLLDITITPEGACMPSSARDMQEAFVLYEALERYQFTRGWARAAAFIASAAIGSARDEDYIDGFLWAVKRKQLPLAQRMLAGFKDKMRYANASIRPVPWRMPSFLADKFDIQTFHCLTMACRLSPANGKGEVCYNCKMHVPSTSVHCPKCVHSLRFGNPDFCNWTNVSSVFSFDRVAIGKRFDANAIV